MRSLFPGHFRPSADDFKSMWSSCIFAVDTNVLLNLYRYSPETRGELERALTSIREQLFIPHQAAKEFLTNRLSVTAGQAEEYSKAIRTLNDLFDKLSNKKRHPFLSEDDMPRFKADADRLVAQLESQRAALLDRPNSDEVLGFIESIVKDRVGNPFDEGELKALAKEGEARYQNSIPPGYRDGKKESDGNVYRRFGDLIIWKQLIAKATAAEKPVIFITDDKKDDWWLEQSGKIVGPRTELREEFISLVKKDFWMYTVDRFLEENARMGNAAVNQNAIDEIITVSHDAQGERPENDEAIDLEHLRIYPGNGFALNDVLTGREIDVLALSACGFTSAEIANWLKITHRTVESHIASVLRKLGLRSVGDLVRFWARYEGNT